ncbi:hypothetical protein [Pseudaestuariivita atlantica]|uniref:Uncharacterized protein n=1 Tax=Pseudaestuariivita atlantica TaxID=1317121 RepID=A0A0L1JL64_9RHOB|nr:hypothetical protein [Pseudaestuariivita atlantica]KNG92452.1 hypothetical protein ATO11_17755 [Pseudaestuariivita atlantica]
MRALLIGLILGVYAGGYGMVRFLNGEEIDGQLVVTFPSQPTAVATVFGPAVWVDNYLTGTTSRIAEPAAPE